MKIVDIFSLRKKAGELGIEIEMEGTALPRINTGYWVSKRDGSLRGEALEYVLAEPIKRKHVKAALDELAEYFKKAKSTLTPSDRCGVHVHINMQQYDTDQMIKFITLYLILEELLTKYCGEEREGNLFCLRASDAEYLISALIKARRSDDWYALANENIRYAAMNVTSLRKFGSIEIRSFRTDKDIYTVEEWVKLLLCVLDKSQEFASPQAIVENFSSSNPVQFLDDIFGPLGRALHCKHMHTILMEGVRRTQDLAYSTVLVDTKKKADRDARIIELTMQKLKKYAVGTTHNVRSHPTKVVGPTFETREEARAYMDRTQTLTHKVAFQYNGDYSQQFYREGEFVVSERNLYKAVLRGTEMVLDTVTGDERGEYTVEWLPVGVMMFNMFKDEDTHGYLQLSREWANATYRQEERNNAPAEVVDPLYTAFDTDDTYQDEEDE